MAYLKKGILVVRAAVEGKRVTSVEKADAAVGVKLTFEDGTTLEIGYSGGEGMTHVNGVEVEED